MRIALIENALTVGGTLTMAANVCRGLKEYANHEVAAVIAVDPAVAAPYFGDSASLKQLRIPYDYMRSRALKRAFDRFSLIKPLGLLLDNALLQINRVHGVRLARYLKRLQPDIIHLNNGSFVLDSLAALGIPIVFHLHGLFSRDLSEDEFRLFSRVTRFIAVSRVVRDSYVAAGLDPARVSVVNNFVLPRREPPLEVSEARRLIGLPEQGEVVGFVGRIVPWKGPCEFIAAMSIVARSRPDARFLLVGDSSETPEYVAALHAQIAACGLDSRVHFIEHLDDTYLAYRAATVVVHASIEPEPFGMVVVEAMQAGTPVVAASQGGPSEIIEDGSTGRLVDPKDAAALASAVSELLENERLRHSLALAAQEHVARHFSVERSIEGISQNYQLALQDATHARAC